MDDAEIDRIFYSDGYRIAMEDLSGELNTSAFIRAVHRLYDSVDGLMASFRDRSAVEGKPVECRRGCRWCCYQPVFAATHELFCIREYVQKSLPEELQEELQRRAVEKSRLTLQISHRELYRFRHACPFLDRGSCLIYEVRPMACRIYLSSSAESCKREYRDPEDREHIPELFRFPLRAGRMLNEGFAAHLRQLGLPVNELPLEQGYSSMAGLEIFPRFF